MIGYALAAGTASGVRRDLAEIADYFHVPPDILERAIAVIESSDRPKVLLLQNFDAAAKISATTIFSSVWSKSYEKFGNPYGKTHRDFHYQVMFCAMAALEEVGCDKLGVDHPMLGRPWRRDAYVCLLEATTNLRKHRNSKLAAFLQKGTYDSRMPRTVDACMASFDMQDHRPVGISPYLFEGINMRTVFVERALDAMGAASGLAPAGLH
jgi:hypothetical protein